MNLIEKIKKFFKRLKGEKEILIEESKTSVNQNRKMDFIKNVDARKQKEILDLQENSIKIIRN